MPGRSQLHSLRTRALNWQSFRSQPSWPASTHSDPARLGVVIVNYNTVEFTSMLLWSLRRIADSSQVVEIVVVDNGSSDGSRQVLRHLADEGHLCLIANRVQRFHGPGLNQGIRHLARTPNRFDQILVVDSDVVFLRRDAITAPSAALRSSGAALLGEYHNGTVLVEGGYAHIATLFIDPRQVIQPRVPPFIDSGQPGVMMQKHLRQQGVAIEDFPLRSGNYTLHAENATLAHLVASGDRRSSHAEWARSAGVTTHKFHGNPDGERLLARALSRFRSEVPHLTGEAVSAVLSGPLLDEID